MTFRSIKKNHAILKCTIGLKENIRKGRRRLVDKKKKEKKKVFPSLLFIFQMPRLRFKWKIKCF